MSSLPQEIIIEILSRLPVKSLLQLRCVCKSWQTLISEPHFVYSHLNRSIQNDNLSLIFKSGPDFFDLHSPVDLQSPCHEPLKLDFQFQNLPLPSMTDIVGSCNGLLLCLSTKTNTIFILNPSTRTYKQLPDAPPVQYPRYKATGFPVLGFGYSSLTREYKVLRILYLRPDPDNGSAAVSYQTKEIKSDVQVYTLGTTSWRRIVHNPGEIIEFDRSSGTLLDGSLHWIVSRGHIGSLVSVSIVSFDIGNEEFHHMPLPEFYENKVLNFSDFLGVLRGSLCLCRNRNVHKKNEIWVMKEYGSRESWTRQFTITQPTIFGVMDYFRRLRFLHNGDILLRRTNGKLILYDPRSESYKDLMIHGIASPDPFGGTIDYVESLVSVKDSEPEWV